MNLLHRSSLINEPPGKQQKKTETKEDGNLMLKWDAQKSKLFLLLSIVITGLKVFSTFLGIFFRLFLTVLFLIVLSWFTFFYFFSFLSTWFIFDSFLCLFCRFSFFLCIFGNFFGSFLPFCFFFVISRFNTWKSSRNSPFSSSL